MVPAAFHTPKAAPAGSIATVIRPLPGTSNGSASTAPPFAVTAQPGERERASGDHQGAREASGPSGARTLMAEHILGSADLLVAMLEERGLWARERSA